MHLISHIQYAAKIFVMVFSPYFDTFMCFLLCISVSVGQYHSESGSNVSQPCCDQSETVNLVAHLIFYWQITVEYPDTVPFLFAETASYALDTK